MSSRIDYYGRECNAYKAALHIHSTVSDGKFTPEEIITLYSERGFDALAFTDHLKTNKVSQYDSKGMTLISGMEIHPKGPRDILWHFVGLGLPEDFRHPEDGTAPQEAIDLAKAAGAAVICAHPYWCAFTVDEIAALRNLDGIEVYNTACRKIARGYNMIYWDLLSDKGLVYPATAVDDTHSKNDLFMGWTMIMADDRRPETLVASIKKGMFYASQGPEFKRLSYCDGVFEAEFSPCTEVIGLSNFSRGYCVEMENLDGPDTGFREITSCSIKLRPYPHSFWFRLQIMDRNGKFAWSAPIVIPGEAAAK